MKITAYIIFRNHHQRKLHDAPLSRSEYNISNIISLYSVLAYLNNKTERKTWILSGGDGRRGAKLKHIRKR